MNPSERPVEPSASGLALQAAAEADRAAQDTGIVTGEVTSMAQLRGVSELFAQVWGRSPEGVPIHSEILREIDHAGGCVTGAWRDDELVGAAVLGIARPAGATYGHLAAARPGLAGRGVGRALKLAQRAWALNRGLTSMRWTFDPLVARNARFNLARLGAVASEYEVAFFGHMDDEVNRGDEADRLVAHWRLDDERVAALAAGTAPPEPVPDHDAPALAAGPDGSAMLRRDGRGLWLRVPVDVVALRRDDPARAAAWRTATRDVFTTVIASGGAAVHATRDGWYLLREAS